MQSHCSDRADVFHRKYKTGPSKPTSQPETKLTEAELLILEKNKVKHFQPEKGRSSLSDRSGAANGAERQIPVAQLKVGVQRLNQRPPPSAVLAEIFW